MYHYFRKMAATPEPDLTRVRAFQYGIFPLNYVSDPESFGDAQNSNGESKGRMPGWGAGQ